MFLKEFKEFLDAYKKKDPASRSYLEIVTCYPGVHAVFFHKISIPQIIIQFKSIKYHAKGIIAKYRTDC